MKVVSTNIGVPQVVNWKGRDVKTGIFKNPVNHTLFLGKEDVTDDHVIDRKYHGGEDKACYLYSADHYRYWKNRYPELEMPFGIFGENLTIEGLHEAQINIGDIFKIGEAVVQATQPRQPCFKLEFRFHNNQIVQEFIDSGFSGVYIRVLTNGAVNKGDSMELVKRADSLSVHKIFELLYTSTFQEEAVRKAIEDPFIAASCKKDLMKRWKIME